MKNQTSSDNKDTTLQALEARVDQLIDSCERLQAENRLLRDQIAQLGAEKEKLMQQNGLARHRVESILTRLRTMEHDA